MLILGSLCNFLSHKTILEIIFETFLENIFFYVCILQALPGFGVDLQSAEEKVTSRQLLAF